jgi:glycosyltransferase involved in cell wall biosynthesis
MKSIEDGNTNMTKDNLFEDQMSTSFGLKIAMCPPELQPLQHFFRGEPTNATYIIQGYVATGLIDHGHNLTFVIPLDLSEITCTNDILNPAPACRTWTKSKWFRVASKLIWSAQRALKIPYLNFFSNYRLYDACLQCLPGHDLVYQRNGLYKMGIAMACKKLRIPYILYIEADEILEFDVMEKPITGLLRWRARETTRYNLQAADCILCVSEELKSHLSTNWKIPTDKILVFPNVADIQRFKPDRVTSQEVRASYNMDTNPILIFVGNFYIWHDVSTLLEAFSQVIVKYPEARLILVGDGIHRQKMMKRAIELGVGDATKFTGMVHHSEIPRLLAAADIAIVPYPVMTTELWLSPLKLYEYMAAGKAIIASAIGQINNVIRDGQNGLLVPPEDVSAMATAMQRLINDPGVRTQLSQNAREDAVRKHSWEQYISRLERVFEAVVEGRPFNRL